MGVVYIFYWMEEIFKIIDFVIVMRDGVIVDIKEILFINFDELVKKMVGWKLEDYYFEKYFEIGFVVFEVSNFCGDNFEDVFFYVCKGEIFGFFGLMGVGCIEVMWIIFGIDKKKFGKVKIDD